MGKTIQTINRGRCEIRGVAIIPSKSGWWRPPAVHLLGLYGCCRGARTRVPVARATASAEPPAAHRPPRRGTACLSSGVPAAPPSGPMAPVNALFHAQTIHSRTGPWELRGAVELHEGTRLARLWSWMARAMQFLAGTRLAQEQHCWHRLAATVSTSSTPVSSAELSPTIWSKFSSLRISSSR